MLKAISRHFKVKYLSLTENGGNGLFTGLSNLVDILRLWSNLKNTHVLLISAQISLKVMVSWEN